MIPPRLEARPRSRPRSRSAGAWSHQKVHAELRACSPVAVSGTGRGMPASGSEVAAMAAAGGAMTAPPAAPGGATGTLDAEAARARSGRRGGEGREGPAARLLGAARDGPAPGSRGVPRARWAGTKRQGRGSRAAMRQGRRLHGPLCAGRGGGRRRPVPAEPAAGGLGRDNPVRAAAPAARGAVTSGPASRV